MAKSFAEIRAEINTDIYENTSGMVTATNVNKDLQDIIDKVEEVQFSDVPAAAVGQVNPIKYNRTRNADGSAVWTVDTGGGSGTVADVKIGSASIVDASGVATIPNATVTQPGLVTGNTLSNPARVVGIVDSNTLAVETASAAIKGVMQDVPAAAGSYVRKRESSGASFWEATASASPDTAMSDTSTNAVQNKVIKSYVDNAVATEATNRQTADNALDARLDVIEPRLPAGSGALALQADLNTEITDRTTAVSNEATVRSTADTTLQSNIDTEATNRQTGDSNLHTEITTETTAREAADVTLQNNIDAEETARINADTALATRVTTLEGLHQSGKTVAQEVSDGIAGLDVTDTPVAGEFVTSVSEVDGKVSVTRSAAITEVQLNGTALTPTAGAVNIPASSWDKIGVLKVGGSAAIPANRTKHATSIYDGTLYVANASTTQVGVVTVGDNIVVTDASQGKISVPDASNTVKGVLLDVPAQDPSTATEDKKFVRVAKQDGTIAWEEGSGASGVTSIKVGPSGTAQTGAVTIPVATTTTNGVCKVGLLTSTSTDPVASSVLYTEFQKKADEVPAATTEDVEYVRKRKTDGTVEWTKASSAGLWTAGDTGYIALRNADGTANKMVQIGTADGSFFINGIGGYDGTNVATAKSVQYILNRCLIPDDRVEVRYTQPKGGSVTAKLTDGTSLASGSLVEKGTSVVFTATADTGFNFKKWSDNSTDNPHTVVVNDDVNMEVIVLPPLITFTPNDTTLPMHFYIEENYEIGTDLKITTDGGSTFTKINLNSGYAEFEVEAGKTAQFYGENSVWNESSNHGCKIKLVIDSSYSSAKLSGSLSCLITGFSGTELTSDFSFTNLFYDSAITDASEFQLMNFASDTYYIYVGMFAGCSLLTATPTLPNMTATGCYQGMFAGCSSLTVAPTLPTTLSESCFAYMFYDCNALAEITCNATDITATDCTNSWTYNLPATGIFHGKLAAGWTDGANGIPNGWTKDLS